MERLEGVVTRLSKDYRAIARDVAQSLTAMRQVREQSEERGYGR
ncbi:MAG: hypothetical protein OXG35_03835 [Acidobacteria bacterium]|nr:hypothetical protein [Acidobacteriota bacterium]